MATTKIQTPEVPQRDANQTRPNLVPSIFLEMAGKHVGVNVFSEAFVWNSKFSMGRFGAVLGGGAKERQTLLEAVVLGPLTSEQRSVIFPTAFHPGSDQRLERDQCTYQAIADAVARTCKFSDGAVDEKFVKQTANALSELTGSPVAQHRAADPMRFTRTVWLFSYLKKMRGPGIVGMLKPPGTGAKPSLEITNPYPLGTQNEKRAQFADVVTYLSLQLPDDMRERIDSCLPLLMPAMERFIEAIKRAARSRTEGQQDRGAVMQDRLQLAKLYYQKQLDELRTLADQSVKPFDETLYIHARTLELRHYAEFRTILKRMPAQRPELAQFWVRGLMEAPPQRMDAIDAEYSVESYRSAAQALFNRSVDKNEVLKATQLARHVLRHHLPLVRQDPLALEKPIEFATMFAAVIYSLKLGEDQAAHNYNPHVYGQGRVPTSLVSAIKGNPNDRHEEFEHMIVDAVDWYRANLLCGLDIYRELLEMRDVVEQGVAKLCATNDLVVMEKALSLMNQVPSVDTWEH
ncbi:hypothetical protein [Acidovorax sp. PRC11]|uniref:hypothetical protein n=1 Tax=Acidovorax sp. PRC11 TaxID=2962592 RepID=UPI0028828CDF|nr:hypothetical protein [Acidovorax sp. PRC11]MDT0140219.1 hypothetical protein [Acidovorax sp. PRC11]